MHTVGSRKNLGYFCIRIRILIFTDPVQGVFETGSAREVMPGMNHLEMERRIRETDAVQALL